MATGTTFIPAITAEAALVPWAEVGMRHNVALRLPVLPVVAADGQQPRQLALGPGIRLDGNLVVAGDFGQPALQLGGHLHDPDGVLGRREGVRLANSGQVMAAISAVALSFMVHEPSGIMLRSSA